MPRELHFWSLDHLLFRAAFACLLQVDGGPIATADARLLVPCLSPINHDLSHALPPDSGHSPTSLELGEGGAGNRVGFGWTGSGNGVSLSSPSLPRKAMKGGQIFLPLQSPRCQIYEVHSEVR